MRIAGADRSWLAADRRAGARGLTLVEVMLVVAILAAIGMLAVPMIGRTDHDKLRSAAMVLSADLAFAQSDSISHADDPRVVVFSPDEARYFVAASSSVETAITNPATRRPYVMTFGGERGQEMGGVAIHAVSSDVANTIGFGMYGQLTQATSASVTLSCNGRYVTVTVDPTSGQTSIGQITRTP